MMTKTSLPAGLPPALRARGFFLYLEGGRRLTDLWLLGGRAILGHKQGRFVQNLKNAAERGLFAPLPHPEQNRFLKALARLLPGREFRVYGPDVKARQVLEDAGLGPKPPPDPALGEAPGDVSLWRPFLEAPQGAPAHGFWEKIPVLVPVLPEPWGLCVLALNPGAGGAFPPSCILPPALLAPVAGAVYDLIAAMNAPPRRIPVVVEKTRCPWTRRGVYLSLRERPSPEEWSRLFSAFLEADFLIPPDPASPLILPGGLSPGIAAKLEKTLHV